ncbi:glycosyl hydrolase family 18 protein [Aquimarina sp. AU474]|uniref:glycosyl hydrolase family 18 protein n=1 Tax=Aquimarina sp. AU474 TaxID=2108529 RepID=UPI000D68BED4|nr:glycosyl hydrolase family 18 protein [Aquimarina sp. AU474]
MKILINILVLYIVCIGCRSDIKDKNSTIISGKIKSISKRHLDDKTLKDANYTTEEHWDSVSSISNKKVMYKEGKLDSRYKTFGWHPYYNGSSYKTYNFSMLWGVSYHSYSIQPKTGSYKNIHQWKTTALVDSAKVHNCKVFLSITNFGKANNTVFLKNIEAQNTLIDSVSNLLAYRGANGINIDFEGVPEKSKIEFSKFIIRTSERLKKIDPSYMVSLSLYAIDWNNIFDINAIDSHIDFYTLMGYDYYGGFSKIAGPVTPFTNSKKFGNGLVTSITHYKNKGVVPKKLIVGLPYYGAEWYTSSDKIGANVVKFKSHPPYKSIRKIDIDSLGIPLQFDTNSSSSYMTIKDSSNIFRQLYFEDVKSLSIKYDWIKNNNIGGVGVWCLGYDNGYAELWDLLTEKFSEKQNTTLYNNK